MRDKSVYWHLITITVIGALLLALPAPALADGGPILTEPQLWAQLADGKQIAVVQLIAQRLCSPAVAHRHF